MNISKAKRILDAAKIIKQFSYFEQRTTQLNSNQIISFHHFDLLAKGLHYLSEMKDFFPKVDEIINDEFFISLLDRGDIDPLISNNILVKKLLDKVQLLLQDYDVVYSAVSALSAPDAGKNSISIRISKVRDLDDLYKAVRDFDIIFSQLILNERIGGSLEIKNVENGSVWLDVFVGTPLAVSVIGSLTWAAAVVYKKIQEGRIIEEHVKSLKIKNDSLNDMRSAQDALLKSIIEIEDQNIENQYFGDGNNERLERIKNSISLLANQIEKGSEVHPYLNAPEDVKNLFPDMKKLPQIESKIPRLSE